MGRIISDGIDYSGLVFAEGCFIDTDNVITSGSYSSTFSYTATVDCYIRIAIAGSASSSSTAYIDGKQVFGVWNGSNGIYTESPLFPLKKGQTLTVNASNSASSSYIVYGIQQGSPITFLSEYASACYSDTEREVGCWVDGKPIYAKTISLGALPNNAIKTVPHGIANVDLIFVADSFFVTSNGASSYLNFTNDSTSGQTEILVDKTNVEVWAGSNRTSWNGYVTVYYTKTTDTAGSGHLTPTGTPTVHYSTEETCIGTWVDGKPLYEKTINCGTLPNNTTKNVTHSISNLEYAVAIKGSAKNPNNGIQIPIPYVYGNIKCLQTYIDSTYIKLISTENLSVYTESYVTIQYTKSTD